MKISIALILASAALLSGSAVSAKDAKCRDAKGHFTKCHPAAAPAAGGKVTHTSILQRVTHTTTSAAPAGKPTAKCKDGSVSYSKTHSGTCSHHGGVASWS